MRNAVAGEVKMIENRIQKGLWQNPRHFVPVTNAPIDSKARTQIEQAFHSILPDSTVTSLGAGDISNLLDIHPALRKSFPEIMGLRDLDALLSEVVNKAIIERSRDSIEEARELVAVFVPTKAYDRAWKILRKHNFVVLDGPPEMGKTAIARMIALAQLSNAWQAIECRYPDDFYSSFRTAAPQVFVADDAFGRTEYDPTLGKVWERDLPKVFRRLDRNHWLIWTARKHILVRAIKDMDLTGPARNFPDPGELVVAADELSVEEKARILYRHARAANLDDEMRLLLRENARMIVEDAHFTPERIRRFVQERLPEFAARKPREPEALDLISEEIVEAIRNPTSQMRKSFRRLSDAHQWILIALLDCREPVAPVELENVYERHRHANSRTAFKEGLDDMVGAFLKLHRYKFRGRSEFVDWIHPSYRDLVIDELATQEEMKSIFLTSASVIGISLALSEAGGLSGARVMPLLGSEQSWSLLNERCREISANFEQNDIGELMDILTGAASLQSTDDAAMKWIPKTTRDVCEIAYQRWNDSGERIAPQVLRSYGRAVLILDPRPPFPNLLASWASASDDLETEVSFIRIGHDLDPNPVQEWVDIFDVIAEYDEDFFDLPDIQDRYMEIAANLKEMLEKQLEAIPHEDDPDLCEAEAERLELIADALSSQQYLDDYVDWYPGDFAGRIEGLAGEWRQLIIEEPDVENDYLDHRAGSAEEFDIEALFSDL